MMWMFFLLGLANAVQDDYAKAPDHRKIFIVNVDQPFQFKEKIAGPYPIFLPNEEAPFADFYFDGEVDEASEDGEDEDFNQPLTPKLLQIMNIR